MRSSIPARLLLPSLQKHHPKGIRIRAKVPLDTMSAEEEKPLFSDATGEALNASAWNLVREATALDTNVSADDDDMNDDPASMRWIETVEMTPGRHKYVLMKVYNEETNEKKFLVRSYARCSYHAENFQRGGQRTEKRRADGDVESARHRGGRIEYDKEKKRVFVYGYSMTFGRTPGCNKKTMEIIRKRFAEEDSRRSSRGVRMVRRGVLAFFLSSSSSVLNSRAIAIILYSLLYQLSKLPKPPVLFADVVVAFAFLRRCSSSSSSISSEFINFVAFTFAVDPVTKRPMPDPTILGPIFFFFSSSSSIFSPCLF